MPHDLVGGLPECGGWTALALAATCWEEWEEERARLVEVVKPFPVSIVGGC